MNTNQNINRISLLPVEKGKNVIKVTLDPRAGENECALLYVPARSNQIPEGGQVINHRHENDSEIYIPLNDIQCDDYGFMSVPRKPEIAGKNSPTNLMEHSIKPSDQARVYFAIKRSNKQGAWKDYTDNSMHKFLSSLNFAVGDWIDERNRKKKGLEFNLLEQNKNGVERKVGVRIDFNSNRVIYVDRRKPEVVREETTLAELKNPQKDYGIEM